MAVPILILLVAILALTNLASLLSDRFHSAAYQFVSSGLVPVCGLRCVEHSPMEVRKRQVEVATNDIAAKAKELEQELVAVNAKTLALVAATEILVATARTAAGKTDELVYRTALATAATNRLVATHKALRTAAGSASIYVAGRVQKSATRKVSTMVGQAIPYVGTTVIWAVTFLDVKDACDAMKSLAELAIEAEAEQVADARTVCGLAIPSVSELNEMVATSWSDGLQKARDIIIGDGRTTVVLDTVKWPYEKIKDTVCYVFGC